MEEDFQSLSKGVFVIPFQPRDGNEAGPSRQPLYPLYENSLKRHEQAFTEYEAARTAEQLDDIVDWLERCAAPPLLKRSISIHRIPIAIVQNAATSLGSLLPTLGALPYTLHAREASDLTSCVRAISTGFIGEMGSTMKKSGRTGIEEVEIWWKARKDKSPLLLHIEQAQQVPSTVLAELVYILTLHPDLPVRVLFSVPSTATFLTAWTNIEPSSIDICILQSGRTRRRTGGVNAILKEHHLVPLGLSEELADELKGEDGRLGGGGTAALKSLKWLLLHHSMNSPLAQLGDETDSEQLQRVQALVNAIQDHPDDHSIPGRELFQLHPQADLSSAQNPAPRMSVLHALSNSLAFVSPDGLAPAVVDPTVNGEVDRATSPSPRKSARKPSKRDYAELSGQVRSKRSSKAHEDDQIGFKRSKTNGHDSAQNGTESEGNELKELQMLFELWRGAGKSVNLWDWLEGFRGAMTHKDDDAAQKVAEGQTEQDGHEENGADGGMEVDEVTLQTNKGNPTSSTDHLKETDDALQSDKHAEAEEARLHAVFIRFCEEARMMGLVRARGKGRKADEVVKGVGLV